MHEVQEVQPVQPVQPVQAMSRRRTLITFDGEQLQVTDLDLCPNFAYGPDGTFRGQNRQAARTAQLSLQFEF